MTWVEEKGKKGIDERGKERKSKEREEGGRELGRDKQEKRQ